MAWHGSNEFAEKAPTGIAAQACQTPMCFTYLATAAPVLKFKRPISEIEQLTKVAFKVVAILLWMASLTV